MLPLAGAAVGQALAAAGVSVETSSAADEDVADAAFSLSDPQAASDMVNAAAQAASATGEDTREKFTAATLQA